jgi:SAM-dependent methyltransferase
LRYSDAVAIAPPGSHRFRIEDLALLSPSTLALLLEQGPANPPLPEIAAALSSHPELAGLFPEGPARDRLCRLLSNSYSASEAGAAARRLVRGLFWTFVYELEPGLWDRLAACEQIQPDLVEALPIPPGRVLEVASGSGRLTLMLAQRARRLVAVEPSRALGRLLQRRLQHRRAAIVVAAHGHRLPVRGGWADLVVSSATFGPHPPLGGEPVLAELERCAAPGGMVALVGPEDPAWFEARGYHRRRFPPAPPPAYPPDLEAFFGPPSPPPSELLLKIV